MKSSNMAIMAIALNVIIATTVWGQQVKRVNFLFGSGVMPSKGSCDTGCGCETKSACGCESGRACDRPSCGIERASCGCEAGSGGCGKSHCRAKRCFKVCIPKVSLPKLKVSWTKSCCSNPSSCDCSGKASRGGRAKSSCGCESRSSCGCESRSSCGCGSDVCDCSSGGYSAPRMEEDDPFRDDPNLPPIPPAASRGRTPSTLPHSYYHRPVSIHNIR